MMRASRWTARRSTRWKVPTNRDLGFIGTVRYLADDIPNVRIPVGVLSSITDDTMPFH